MNSSEKDFRKRWGNFFSTIFDVPVLFFIFCTVFLACANYLIKDNRIITVVITALMILSGGLAGAFFRKRWEELTERPHLVVKGKMAVRNLRLLLNNIGYYELQLKKYIRRIEQIELPRDRANEYFEEFIDWCLSLREICLTSIENWEDIIPEVKDLTSRIGNLSDLKISEEKLNSQIDFLSKRLEEAERQQDKTAEEKNQLQKQLSEKEEEVKKIEQEVKELKKSIRSSVGGLTTATLSTSGYSGINYLAAGHYGTVPFDQRAVKKICQHCKREYTTNALGLLHQFDNICDECSKIGIVKPIGGGS